MNILNGQQNIELTPRERRFAATEEHLFTEAGVDVRSRFLGGERRIHVLETGAGRPLLMIHGGNSVAAAWTPLWAELGGGCYLVAQHPTGRAAASPTARTTGASISGDMPSSLWAR
jgi:hypothetical protein